MKFSRSDVLSKSFPIDILKFEDQRLTSFAGLVVFQVLFDRVDLKERLKQCFRHLKVSSIFGTHRVILLLVVHLLLGYRELRDIRYYRDDPMVKRSLGLKKLPDVATISRTLANTDTASVEKFRAMIRQLVIQRLQELAPARLSLDFDGTVQSTQRYAQGTAVGFNKKKKGARSYYPLFCTIAQTAQVFDIHHRPGNVHDSNGAEAFILGCIRALREQLPRTKIEVRMDSAFFSDAIVKALDGEGVEFTISVPFERYTELKTLIEGRCRWRRYNHQWSYFESNWRPKKWRTRYRFIFIRQSNQRQQKGVVQLDLFTPYEVGYDFKVIVTNKTANVKKVANYHQGRGMQENLFAQLKSQAQMDYVPTRTLVGNQLYLFSSVLTHNLVRELHMQTQPQDRNTTEKRSPRWIFTQIDTLRRDLIQRAGRLTKPEGRLTLTLSANEAVKSRMLHILDCLRVTA